MVRTLMFTGLITHRGVVAALTPKGGDLALRLQTDLPLGDVPLGASIACGGVCLTVVAKDPAAKGTGAGTFDADVSAETLSKTTLGAWQVGKRINLERSLRLGDELGGHLVYGHVDGVARLVDRDLIGESLRLTFEAPAGFASFVAAKGSVALDGVSLTVNAVDGPRFAVNIIPHTQTETTLGDLVVGDGVNFEADMLARYVARLMEGTHA
jgi:riboflavin synthase